MKHFISCTPSTMNQAEFVAHFKDIYEHSPWMAEAVYAKGLDESCNSIEALHKRFTRVLLNAKQDRQMALIKAHPDLAGKAAIQGTLTQASSKEQAGAGIDACTPQELAMFKELNMAYKDKFDFPFIMAVKGSNRHKILAAFKCRLPNSYPQEFSQALQEINKIAYFRLAFM